jgi:hypothetical protein
VLYPTLLFFYIAIGFLEQMTLLKEKNIHYNKVFKISLIISLFFLTLLFYFFPKFMRLQNLETQKIKVDIFVSDIPPTEQMSRVSIPPRKPYGIIPMPVAEDVLPDELLSETGEKSGAINSNLLVSGIPPEIPAKPILEVYPNVADSKCTGQIRLLILINEQGKSELIEIVENTTQNSTCLKLVINAANKSRWIPAKVNNKPVSSWVTKSYKFDIRK